MRGLPPCLTGGSIHQGLGYDQALYSNWVADSYTDADIICILDPDMVFTTRTALYSMFRWDVDLGLYKPLIACIGNREGYNESHYLFPVYPNVWPHPVYCMAQLPVCIHRSTLIHIRQELTQRFRTEQPEAYAAVNTSKDEFAVTYWLLTVSLQSPEPLCQYCAWSTFVMSNPIERPLYFFTIGAAKNETVEDISAFNALHTDVTMCPVPRVSGHVNYINDLAKWDLGTYASVSNDLLLDGVCRGVSNDTVVDCMTDLCMKKLYDDRSFQQTMTAWEQMGIFASTAQEVVCKEDFNRTLNALQDWQREFDSMEEYRWRLCGQQGNRTDFHHQ